ncbi:DUF2577 domain-containing protein [Lactobacillus sp. S2-2]|uniref:DUF2577 domain-containing protein n=1 Tax=Lactobacillus sp. S2-2 TaxID=2692917 RepID=UPI001F488760|nr:DUF2577 domain-containing protein [Lactobacillus sp. S2-2]MCF6515550.1 DUF2577 domain-containing protein [Lactobacillus sp. S2-2]
MAGEWLLNQLSKRGGSNTDYSDVVFGKVVSDSPLKVQYANDLILTKEFLIVSKYCTDYEEEIEIDKKKKKIKHFNKLKKGDDVTMLRQDGGQGFFIIEYKRK